MDGGRGRLRGVPGPVTVNGASPAHEDACDTHRGMDDGPGRGRARDVARLRPRP